MANDPKAKAHAEKISSMVEQMSPEQRAVWNKLAPGNYVPTVAECALLKPVLTKNKDMLKSVVSAAMPGVGQAVGEEKIDAFFEAIRTADPSLIHSILSFAMRAKKIYAGMQARFGKWTNLVIVAILALIIIFFLWLSYRVLAWIFGMLFGFGASGGEASGGLGGAAAPAASAPESLAEDGEGYFDDEFGEFGEFGDDYDDGEM